MIIIIIVVSGDLPCRASVTQGNIVLSWSRGGLEAPVVTFTTC